MSGRAAVSRVLRDLVQVVGEPAALALVWHFRGTNLYVPKEPATNPAIAAAIGADAATRLCEVFWGTMLYMPFREALELKVQQMAEEGTARRAIALALGIPERQVYRILDRHKRDSGATGRESSDQPTLFTLLSDR